MNTELSAPLRLLLETIERFERDEVDVEMLQAAVRSAEDSVTEYELRDLRNFLQSSEGKLELIRFTVEREHVPAEALKVAQDVSARIRSTFALPSPDRQC